MKLKLTRQLFVITSKIFTFLLVSVTACSTYAQTTRNAGTYAELTAAVTASSDNDIINLTDNIVVTAQVSLSKTLTFNGNSYYITVPNNGITDAGIINTTTASTFRVFQKTDATKSVIFNNITLKGGNIQGGCILVSAGIVRFNSSVISNGRNSSSGGGGIYNTSGATVYLNNCRLIRNSASYGGGLENSGTIYVESSTFAENRSESTGGGGGAVQANSGSVMYINNSTFSNNKSTEIGGAINVYSGTVWVMNSTFSGNIGYGSLTAGGAIGVNNGTAHIINSLFAYNYVRSAGTYTAPTAFTLDDVSKYSGSGTINSYYSIFQGSVAAHNTAVSNVAYTGLADGSNNTVFSNGILTKITDGTGVEIGTGVVYQPFLVNSTGGIAGTLQPASFALSAPNRGTKTGYTNTVGPVAVGYYNGSAWVTLQGANPQTYEITTDQLVATRSIPTARGAVEAVVSNVYMFKVNAATSGSVNGGTLYGDVYSTGTALTVTAFPNAGQQFVRWDYALGGSGIASTSNPYTFSLTQNTTLVPVFQAATGGNYTITYIGNGNTGGSVPTPQTTNLATTVAAQGAMIRTNYIFQGWNTNGNGSGTGYAASAAYSSGSNLTLYAQWQQSGTLPLSWLSFKAIAQDKRIQLTWQTANEINCKNFIVQHSIDGISWFNIGSVNAAGINNQNNNYYFTHTQPVAGNNFYRLQQNDFDANINYSSIIKVNTGISKEIIIFGNPVNDGKLTVQLFEPQSLQLFSADGKLVWQVQKVIGTHQIDVSHLAAGLYTLKNGTAAYKILIQK